jgi:LPXTG-site transpeptidase (sortase) family protein
MVVALTGIIGWNLRPSSSEPVVERLVERAVPATALPSTTPSTERSVSPVDIGRPERVRVDSIAVDAPVLAMGTAPDGSQAVPSSLHETGWWEHGARPGEIGNAVIVGHAASRSEGVFDDLHSLARGDVVTVSGTAADVRFSVTRSFDLPVEDFEKVSARMYRQRGAPGLVLMTCGGWNGEEFETTTIVMAELLP